MAEPSITLKLKRGTKVQVTGLKISRSHRQTMSERVRESHDVSFTIPLAEIVYGDTGTLEQKGQPPYDIKIVETRRGGKAVEVEARLTRVVPTPKAANAQQGGT